MTTSTLTPYIDLAENDTSIFIHINKTFLENEKVQHALRLLRDLVQEPTEEVDEHGIPYVSDEEQAQIEASLDKLTAEDRAVAFTRTIEI